MTSQNRAQMAIMIMAMAYVEGQATISRQRTISQQRKRATKPITYNGNEENMSVLVSQNLAGYSFALSLASVSITVCRVLLGNKNTPLYQKWDDCNWTEYVQRNDMIAAQNQSASATS